MKCRGVYRKWTDNGYNLAHVVKFWVETPEQQQEAQERLLEAARRGVVVIDD